jgi:AhpD family alkylhydroperoxidase
VPNGKVAEVARMLKAIHASENRKAATNKAAEIVTRLKEMRLRTAAELVEQKVAETLTYYSYPSTHWRQIKTNNPLERIIREIRRRTRVVGAFPDGQSALVRLRASQINGCAYCIDLHTRAARKAGESERRLSTLVAWRDTPCSDSFFSDR